LWPTLIDAYGQYRPGISQIRLEQSDGSEIVGTIVIDPNDSRLVLFDIDADTAPQNTLQPIDAIIDPQLSGPGDGLHSSLLGQRYLLVDDTGSGSNVANPFDWNLLPGPSLVAKANDIIQFNGTRWTVVFVASMQTTVQYVTNITTGIQYKWTGDAWIKSYQGEYVGGTWSIVL
jgi:hypothetical protein